MILFKGRLHPQGIILKCVRWYCAYSLSYRNIKEMMKERPSERCLLNESLYLDYLSFDLHSVE